MNILNGRYTLNLHHQLSESMLPNTNLYEEFLTKTSAINVMWNRTHFKNLATHIQTLNH